MAEVLVVLFVSFVVYLVLDRHRFIFRLFTVKAKGKIRDFIFAIPVFKSDNGIMKMQSTSSDEDINFSQYFISKDIKFPEFVVYIPCFVLSKIFQKPTAYIDTNVKCVVNSIENGIISYYIENDYLVKEPASFRYGKRTNLISLEEGHILYNKLEKGSLFSFSISNNNVVDVEYRG